MPLSEMNDPCDFLPWDSEFFGHRIGRVVGHRLSSTKAASILDWCADNSIECLYFLADPDHDETIALAEQNGFHLVDVRATFVLRNSGDLSSQTSRLVSERGIQIRDARSSDIPGLEDIARTAHGDSRFYYDHRFSASQCSDLYATWVRRSYEGFADRVLTADYDGRLVGYITCQCDTDDNTLGHIGLVGVDASARGMGIGPALVKGSLRWFAEQGVQAVKVVTQGRNLPAQRMYQRCGFETYSLQMWYHKWFVNS